jgi:hypothetical protein
MQNLGALRRAEAHDYRIVICVDGNDSVGTIDVDNQSIVGPFAFPERGWKGELFVRFCRECDLALYNTMREDPLWRNTCPYYIRSEPRQIDFVGADILTRYISTCVTRSTAATTFDHKLVLVSLEPENPAVWLKDQCVSPSPFVRPGSKPTGRICNDLGFKYDVVDALGLNAECVLVGLGKLNSSPPDDGFRLLVEGIHFPR